MKWGSWDKPITTDNLRVIVDGVTIPAYKATIKSSMRDGHPAAVSNSAGCVSATIEWSDPDNLSADVPHPFKAGWLPKPGSSIIIQTGDGALDGGVGRWWTQHKGVIDSTTGSIADGTAVSETVDNIEDLTFRATYGALSARMTPPVDSATSYREMGLASSFLIDRMLRSPQADGFFGWHATPPRSFETIGYAPNQGSLWPEVGTLVSCSRRGDPRSGPLWSTTSYGVAPYSYSADYNLVGATNVPVLTIGLTTLGGGMGRVDAHDNAGSGVFVGHDRDTDEVVYGITTPGGQVLYRLPRDGATRAAVYLKRQTTTSQTLIVRVSDGRTVTRDPGAGGYPTGWEAGRVSVDGRAGIGWWMVESDRGTPGRWNTLDQWASARIRTGPIQYWDASRDLSYVNPAEWLDEQLKAECAAMWLDEENVMQWAGRGVLEAQPIAATVTSTSDVIDIQWESRRQSLARSVWVNYSSVRQRSLLGGIRQNAAEGKIYELRVGDEDGESITIPDDEDWLSIDLTPRLLGVSTTPTDLANGSKFGGTIYQETSNGEEFQGWASDIALGCEMTRPTLRSVAIRVWYATYGDPAWRIRTAIPEVADKLAGWHHGNPTLRVRARGILTWTEGQRSLAAGAMGPARYSHDVGWRVQNTGLGDRVGELMSWMRTVVSSHNPTVTGLELTHDPRRQIGDLIRVEDRDVTGMWWTVVITERTVDSDAFTDSIGGRITGYGQIPDVDLLSPGGPTAMTPVTDWTREVAS